MELVHITLYDFGNRFIKRIGAFSLLEIDVRILGVTLATGRGDSVSGSGGFYCFKVNHFIDVS
jgi:hypothetical protein